MHLKRIDRRREIKKKETIEKILRGGGGGDNVQITSKPNLFHDMIIY